MELPRRILLLLGLVNLGVFVTATWCLYADKLYPGSTKTHSGLALLTVSVLISAAMFAMRRARAARHGSCGEAGWKPDTQ